MFVDEVEIRVTAGSGGNGCLSFRREKFVCARRAERRQWRTRRFRLPGRQSAPRTLVNFRFHPEFHADRGVHGEGSNRTGADGKISRSKFPWERSCTKQTAEGLPWLAGSHGDRPARSRCARRPWRTRQRLYVVHESCAASHRARCGRRQTAATAAEATRASPPHLAHLGGRPKIADYPFTTLTPNLGVVGLSDDRSFVVADVPGLIEGAHVGHGLDTQFLSHLERTKVLVHVIDVSSASGRDRSTISM